MSIDQAKLETLMGKVVGHMTGATLVFSMGLGEELGIYRAMVGKGPRTSDSVAHEIGCNARLVREWLDGQAAGGLLAYDSERDTYELSDEAAAILADENAPTFVARATAAFSSFFLDFEKIAAAFRGNGGLAWGDHHPCLFRGTEWFFRPGYRTFLTSMWIPALQGVDAKLRAGGRVADVGCGHGASVVAMARAYPNCRIFGFDFHAPSIETSQQRAFDAGVADRTEFAVQRATTYGGQYDLICFFDCLHDMGDPVGAAQHARERLAPGGTVLLVEPFAIDGRAKNITENPMASLLYTASACVCTPNSLSQEVGLGLGAQAGEAKLRQVFEKAGFTHFRRAMETPVNLIFEARP